MDDDNDGNDYNDDDCDALCQDVSVGSFYISCAQAVPEVLLVIFR